MSGRFEFANIENRTRSEFVLYLKEKINDFGAI
jgi:hypothetical protein